MTEDELAMTDDQLAKLLEQRERIDAKIRKKKGQLREAARKAETHAKIVLGGMLLQELGVAWNEVNFEEAAMRMSAAAAAIGVVSCEPLELEEAKKRLRAWEIEKRHWGDYGPKKAKEDPKPDWKEEEPRPNETAEVPAFDFDDQSGYEESPWA